MHLFKPRTEITNKTADELIKALNLQYGSSFSNNEPSELCSEYRMETGYWLPDGKDQLVRAVTRKDDEGKEYTKSYLFINSESLGMDNYKETITSKELEIVVKLLMKINELSGVTSEIPKEILEMPIW